VPDNGINNATNGAGTNNCGSDATSLSSCGARANYDFTLPYDGKYYVYFVTRGETSYQNELMWGYDGTFKEVRSISTISASTAGWKTNAAANFTTTAGAHSFNLWMKEDGVRVDRIIISNASPYPYPTTIGRVWVRVPVVHASSNSDFFWLYYNNPNVSTTSSGPPYGPAPMPSAFGTWIRHWEIRRATP
jgi:hypothetical protein